MPFSRHCQLNFSCHKITSTFLGAQHLSGTPIPHDPGIPLTNLNPLEDSLWINCIRPSWLSAPSFLISVICHSLTPYARAHCWSPPHSRFATHGAQCGLHTFYPDPSTPSKLSPFQDFISLPTGSSDVSQTLPPPLLPVSSNFLLLLDHFLFHCNTAWPCYKLDNQSQWPENGILDFQILTDLGLYQGTGKWSNSSQS